MEPLVNNIIKAIGWSIFHSLWQGAIVFILLLILTQAFPKLNAKVKHNMAFASISLIFIGFCCTFFSLFQLPLPAADTVKVLVPTAYPAYLQALPLSLGSKTEQFFPLIVAIYLIGIIIQVSLLSSGYLRLLKLKRSSHISVPSSWENIFKIIKSDLGIYKNVGFYLSESVNVPMVLGYFKPIVLFPFTFVSQLDMAHVEALLIHELSHIRRNDYLLNLMKTVMETILFFNPFIWMCSRMIQIEREHACDDLVLHQTGTPLTYAHALLKIELIKGKKTPIMAMAASGNQQYLYQRIKRITDMKTNYMNPKQQLFAIFLTIATITSLAWINPSKSERSVQKETAPKLSKKTKADVTLFRQENLTTYSEILPCDTGKKKKVKILTIDSKGNQTEYNAVKDLPDSLREIITIDPISANISVRLDSLNALPTLSIVTSQLNSTVNSPEFKKQMEKVVLQYNSPEFKKQIEQIQTQNLTMLKELNTDKWRNEQQTLLKKSEEIKKFYSSPEWEKQIAEMKALYSSPEYKELQSKFQREVEQLRKKKTEASAEKN